MPDLENLLFEQFDPENPLKPNDPNYIDYSDVRKSNVLYNTIGKFIRRSSKPSYQLLSGHRGSGKTTELYLLKEKLSSEYFVVYCDINQYANINDLTYTDVFMSILQQLSKEAKVWNLNIIPNKISSFWDGLKDILKADVNPSQIGFSAFFSQFKFDIKNNPSHRTQVRQYLLQPQSNFLMEFNQVINLVKQELASIPRIKDIVIIVDSLDRLYRDPLSGSSGSNLHDDLFINNSNNLCGVACHVIYTLPPAMRLSPTGSRLPYLYSRAPEILPMIPVSYKLKQERNPEGINILKDTIKTRAKTAGLSLDKVFTSEQLVEDICFYSGGYVRGLLTSIREAMIYTEDLPINPKAVESAINALSNSHISAISTQSQWQKLRQVHQYKDIISQDKDIVNKEEDHDTFKLLDNHSIFEYKDDNDTIWYDVNPLLRRSYKF